MWDSLELAFMLNFITVCKSLQLDEVKCSQSDGQKADLSSDEPKFVNIHESIIDANTETGYRPRGTLSRSVILDGTLDYSEGSSAYSFRLPFL
jgi:hypothetical protein